MAMSACLFQNKAHSVSSVSAIGAQGKCSTRPFLLIKKSTQLWDVKWECVLTARVQGYKAAWTALLFSSFCYLHPCREVLAMHFLHKRSMRFYLLHIKHHNDS